MHWLGKQNEGREERRGFFLLSAIAVFFLGLLLYVVVTWVENTRVPEPLADRLQAVFLSNNQVYFGRITSLGSDYMTLSDVYYLKSQVPREILSGETSSQIAVVRLGTELHGPEATMYIPTDSVLFWENLKTDSPVVGSINESL